MSKLAILDRARRRTASIRQTHVATMARASRRLADAVQLAGERMDEAEAGLRWRYRRDGSVYDPLDAALSAIDGAFAALFDEAEAAAKVQRCDERLVELGAGDDAGPTIETLRHLAFDRGDPIGRLAALGRLNDRQVQAAQEIAAVYGWVSSRLRSKTLELAYKSSVEPGDVARSADSADWMSLLHAFVYVPWTQGYRAESRIVLAMAYEGLSMKDAARRAGVSWEAGLALVSAGLSAYRAIRRGYLQRTAERPRSQAGVLSSAAA